MENNKKMRKIRNKLKINLVQAGGEGAASLPPPSVCSVRKHLETFVRKHLETFARKRDGSINVRNAIEKRLKVVQKRI